MEEFTTEQKILHAAHRVFLQKGMDGARMQEIADEAGINKALLHYYYKNKDKLFEAVFVGIFSEFFKKVGGVLISDVSPKEKIIHFVNTYMDTIQANPFAPQFIINEINRDPSIMKKMMLESGIDPHMLVSLFGKNMVHVHYDIRHIIVSMLGLCIFPYVARPLMETVYFENDSKAYDAFLAERKGFVIEMMMKFIERN